MAILRIAGERVIEEAVANLGRLRSRLTPQRIARLASLCVVTCGQASYTRPDGIHVVSLSHLCAEWTGRFVGGIICLRQFCPRIQIL